MGCIGRLFRLALLGVAVLTLVGCWWLLERRMARPATLAKAARAAPVTTLAAAANLSGPAWVRGRLEIASETLRDPVTGAGPFLFFQRATERLGTDSRQVGGEWRHIPIWVSSGMDRTGVECRFVDDTGEVVLSDWNAIEVGLSLAPEMPDPALAAPESGAGAPRDGGTPADGQVVPTPEPTSEPDAPSGPDQVTAVTATDAEAAPSTPMPAKVATAAGPAAPPAPAAPPRRGWVRMIAPGTPAWALGGFTGMRPQVTGNDAFYLEGEDPASFTARLEAGFRHTWWASQALFWLTILFTFKGLRWAWRGRRAG